MHEDSLITSSLGSATLQDLCADCLILEGDVGLSLEQQCRYRLMLTQTVGFSD